MKIKLRIYSNKRKIMRYLTLIPIMERIKNMRIFQRMSKYLITYKILISKI
jgi:hypothetical protein